MTVENFCEKYNLKYIKTNKTYYIDIEKDIDSRNNIFNPKEFNQMINGFKKMKIELRQDKIVLVLR